MRVRLERCDSCWLDTVRDRVKPCNVCTGQHFTATDPNGDRAAKSNVQETTINSPISPDHYKKHPSGVECIEIVQWMPFNIGAAMKYLWRCNDKHDNPITDLKKAIKFIEFEIKRRSE